MAQLRDPHPTDDQLQRYFDSELSAADQKSVRRHVDGCWHCRTRLADLAETVSAIIHARESLLQSTELPPVVWPGLVPRIQEFERASRPALWRRLCDSFADFTGPKTIAVAAGVLLAVFLATLSRPRSISAHELLQRVELSGRQELNRVSRAVVHQRLHVRRNQLSTQTRFDGDYELWRSGSRTRIETESLGREIGAHLELVYRANSMDWTSPLSPTLLTRWRKTLAQTNESVVDGDPVRLITEVPNDHRYRSVHRAEYMVRRADWHPVALRLTLADEEFEVSELAYEVVDEAVMAGSIAPSPELPPAPAVEAVAPEIEPAAIAAPAPAPLEAGGFNPLATHMTVLSAIHELGADLAEPIEVFCCFAGDVVIQASSITDARRRQLQSLSEKIPHTRLDLTGSMTPPGKSLQENPLNLAEQFASRDEGLQERLRKYFGSLEARENFTRELLEQSDAILTRAYALRKLAESWPEKTEVTLDPDSRIRLAAMVEDHFDAVHEAFRRYSKLVRPIFSEFGVAAAPGVEIAPQVWQDASRLLFPDAREADGLIRLIFTGNDRPATMQSSIERLNAVSKHAIGALAGISRMPATVR